MTVSRRSTAVVTAAALAAVLIVLNGAMPSASARTKPPKTPHGGPRAAASATATPTPSGSSTPAATASPTPSASSTPTAATIPTPAPTSTPSGYVVPANIASDCSVNVAAQLLSWLATIPNGATANLNGGCYRVEAVLELRNRNLTIAGNGATLRSLDPPADQRAMWRFWDSTVTLTGVALDGSYAAGGTYSSAVEHAHAVDLRGTDATLSGLTMTDLGGDCVYFGLGSDRSTGSLRDSSCDRIGRNGVSITAGDRVTVERVKFDHIGFIGVDVEPNVGAGWGSDGVLVTASTFGQARLRHFSVIANAPIANQAFTGNTITATTGDPEITIGLPRTGFRPQGVTIADNVSTVVQGPPAIDVYDTDRLTVTGNSITVVSGSVLRVTN